MEREIWILSGPNLNLLGTRQPEVYGTDTLKSLITRAQGVASEYGVRVSHHVSNSEAELVGLVQSAPGDLAGLIVNAGALTHYSFALADALAAKEFVKIELHLSNTLAREPWRRLSVLSPVVNGTIEGFGAFGYELATLAACRLLGL